MIIFIFHFPKVSENEIINVPRGAILFSLEKKTIRYLYQK